ncbi:ATP synthase F0 subunit B [Streptomyces sp. URMC 123]|uniref:ATP synthase F0 subunit B n=1 Tax=Streptomyces sp. URMC 123 TaxID=3423403 RepID=UPI003F1D0819
MDVQKKLDEIVATISSARSMPMSASCVVNRAELLAKLEAVRQALPDSLAEARELLGGRERMVEEARQEAERIIETAHAQRGSLISDTEVARRSQAEADRILAEARREAEQIRAEADDYVDSKLANFEVVLTKTLGSVDRGREKLLGRAPGGDERAFDAPEYADVPEPSSDPATLRQRTDAYVDAKLGAVEAALAATLEAVGRGRLKLQGRRAADELGAHLAAQEGLTQAPSTSDAEYLAGLAAPEDTGARPPAAPPELPAQRGGQVAAQAAGQLSGQDGGQDFYAPAGGYPQGDPHGDPYGYPQTAQQNPYAYQQTYAQQDPYAYPGYGTGQGGYGSGQGGGYDSAGHSPGAPPAARALDETSFFDTGMIDLDRLREYEQGR